MTHRLIRFIKNEASKRTPVSKAPGLTIGLEHEFFVTTMQGSPVSHEQSQQLLNSLAEAPGWHIREKTSDILGEMVSRVSKNRPDGTYTAIKYDHHPHLFEIAFAYRDNLHELNEDVSDTLSILRNTASSLNFRILDKPFLDLDSSDPKVTSELQYFSLLRSYRRKLFIERGEAPSPSLVNYAAVIAATQTHIGGTNWWSNPDLVSALYRYEPFILPITAKAASPKDSLSEILKRRWVGYSAVFSGFPLVGYPHLHDWSLVTWVTALNQSPLARLDESNLIRNSLSPDLEDPELFMKDVRDLQIIRPRLFGTLEFRADPAMPSPKLIIATAALRLATCIGVSSGDLCELSFTEAHNKWWEIVNTGRSKPQTPFIEKAANWLKRRNLGEESFLESLYEFEIPRVA